MDLPVDQWDPETFRYLENLLGRYADQPKTSTLRQLVAGIDAVFPWLLSLTRLPKPSEADKARTLKDTVVDADGLEYKVEGDLLEKTNKLAADLDVAHSLAVRIALAAHQKRHEYINRQNWEVGTWLLSAWTSDLLSFVFELLRVTLSPDTEGLEPFAPLSVKVQDILATRVKVGNGEGTWIDLILEQLDALQTKLDGLARPSQQVQGAQYDLLEYKVVAVRSQQGKLVGMLSLLAEAGMIGRGQAVKVVKWLKKKSRVDGIVVGVLACFYSTLAAQERAVQDIRYDDFAWHKDTKLIRLVCKLGEDADWSNHRLQQATRLGWALFCVAGQHSHREPDLQGYTDDGYPLHALSNNAIELLDEVLSRLRVERGFDDAVENVDALAKLAQATPPENDEFVLGQFRGLVEALAKRKALLKQLRNREEDAPKRTIQTAEQPRHYSKLLDFVTKLFKTLSADRTGDLWQETTFIDSILDGRGPPTPAIWNLLIAISNNAHSAKSAYERLDRTKFSLKNLMGFLAHDAEQLFKIIPSATAPKSHLQQQGQKAAGPFVSIPPDELERLLYWPKLAATIVRHWPAARAAILHSGTDNTTYPLKPLFDMLNTDASLEHKEAFLDAITALITPLCDGQDDDTLSKAAEAFEAISWPGSSQDDVRHMSRRRRLPQQGWLAQVESAEQVYGGYPLTRAYLRFLTTMLSATRWNALRIPYRAVDEVVVYFERFRNGHYQYRLRRSEQYELLDGMLAFVEKAIMRFDMSDLAAMSHNMYDVAWELYQQPGFRVVLELLEDKQGTVFGILANVIDHFTSSDRDLVQDEILRRVLRIYHRILDVQLVFTEVLLLTLDHAKDASRRWTFHRPTDWKSLDSRLLNHLSNVTNIALLVNDKDLQASLLAVKIVYALAGSVLFDQADRFGGDYQRSVNRLAGILDASDDSIRIAQGFHHRLGEEGPALSPEQIDDVVKATLRGEAVDVESLPMAIRSTILDLLLDGTLPDSSANVAHFLLGFEFKGHHFLLQDPGQGRLSCLQVLLEQLQAGSTADEDGSGEGLIDVYPVIAAKTAKLVYQLFSTPLTARATMRYSGARDTFSATALHNLPNRCPQVLGDGQGVVRSRHVQYETTGNAFVAYLDYQRYIIACVSLETHANEGLLDSAASIAEELFGAGEGDPRIIELLSNIDLEWHEPAPPARNIDHFAHFAFDQFKRPDVDWYDLAQLEAALSVEGKTLTGGPGGASSDAIQEEIVHVIDRLGMINRITEVNVAKGALLTAWADALKVALGRVFVRYVPEDRQEDTLFALLDAILSHLDDEVTPGVLEILSEGALIVVDALRSVLAEDDNLPVDQLVRVLEQVVSVIIRPGTTEVGRGNLYAAINQYLSLLTAPIIDDNASVSIVTMGQRDPETEFRKRSLAVLASKRERLFATLCRDALEVRDVWKTECFALLSGLVGICGSEKERQNVLAPLWKEGYLGLFVRSLKDREVVLAECLSPNAVSLHAFWVFEAKIGLLLSVAASRKGAEDLLDVGLFEVLAMCGFIGTPNALDYSVEADEAATRQHRVLVSVLQLLIRAMTSLYRSPRSGAQQALAFLNAHRDTFVELLRNVTRSTTKIAIDEGRLVVSMLAMVVQKVSGQERTGGAAGGFRDFHSAIMEIAGVTFDVERVGELISSQEESSGLEKAILNLNQAILTYLCAYTVGLKAGAGTPVFVNGSHRLIANKAQTSTAPSLILTVDLLADVIRVIRGVTESYERLSPSLREGSGILDTDVERLQKLDWVDEMDLDTEEGVKTSFATKLQSLFNMVESILLLIWRHVLFYANDAKQEPVRPNNLSQSLVASVRASTRAGTASGDAYRSLKEVAKEVRENLDAVSEIAVPTEFRRVTGEAYFGMLIRRLGELTAGLLGDDSA